MQVRPMDALKKTFIMKGHDLQAGIGFVAFTFDLEHIITASAGEDSVIFKRSCNGYINEGRMV
jgi:hypothetical protein